MSRTANKKPGNPAGKRETKHGGGSGKKDGVSGSSFFTWFMVLALLGVWTSVAVVWLDLVDYEEVLDKLGVYDADGDGDFDIEDAKLLLGLKDKTVTEDASEDSEKDSEAASEYITDQDLADALDEIASEVPSEDLSDLEEALDDHEDIQADEASDLDLEEALEPSVHESLHSEPEDEEEPEVAEPAVEEEDVQIEEQILIVDTELEDDVAQEPADVEVEDNGVEDEPEEEEEPIVESHTVIVETPRSEVEEEPEEEAQEETTPEEEEEPVAEEAPEEEEAPAEDVDIAAELNQNEAQEEPQEDVSEEETVEEDHVHDKGDEHEEEEIEEEEPLEVLAAIPKDEPVPEAEPVTETSEETLHEEKSEHAAHEDHAEHAAQEDHEEQAEHEDHADHADHVEHEHHAEHEREHHAGHEHEEHEDHTHEHEEHEDQTHEHEEHEDQTHEHEEHGDHAEHAHEHEGHAEHTHADHAEHVGHEHHTDHSEHVHEDHAEEAAHEEHEAVQQQHIEEQTTHTSANEPEDHAGDKPWDGKKKDQAKKKKPKLLNKLDKTIKAELDAAEKMRKKGKVEEALRAFETLIAKYPQSPRARYGKAQCEDDLAEKLRSNDVLTRAIGTYEEVSTLPNAPSDLIKLALQRRANRQQFLGRMRGSLLTLNKLVQLFPEDISLKNDLGVGYLLIGDNSKAKEVYEEVLSLDPSNGFAQVHYGFILKAENKIAESIPYLRDGLLSEDPGTDDGRFYFHLGDALQRVGDNEAYTWYEIGHKKGHFASVWQRSLYNVDGLKAQPWWTAKETGYTDLVRTLEANWKVIRDEGLAVMDEAKGLFIPEDENLREKGDWSQYTLWQQGRKNEKSCKAAPRTCDFLERFPESTGCRRGQIKYSVMHPGTHVWPHTGPTNCRLRMHLGLVIPKTGCRIRCANDTRAWEEGKVLIFDDSFEHEVWQEANSYRLIFIVDVWHPELTPHQRRTLPAI